MTEKVFRQSRLNRIFHWLFALSILLLIISGFSTYRPPSIEHGMAVHNTVHRSLGFFATGLFWGWVYYHIVTQSYRDFWFRAREIGDLKGLFAYYFFFRKNLPRYGKYNPGQKLIYTAWVFGFLFQSVTGLLLYTANFGNILPFPITLQQLRFYHYAVALWFLGTTPLHIYLAATEDPAKLQAMLTGWVRKR